MKKSSEGTVRECTKCGVVKPIEKFRKSLTTRRVCSTCMSLSARIGKQRDPRVYLLERAKQRSRRNGRECTISIEDIVIPERCPILDIPLSFDPGSGRRNGNAPSLDRIDNSKDYVKGNIAVISDAANLLKNTRSREECIRFATALIAYVS